MERPQKISKDILPYIEYLEAKVNKFEVSPYHTTYLAIKNQIESWNDQLKVRDIDLFADKDSKEFERAFKYFMEASDVLDRLDKMRDKISPREDLSSKAKPLSEDSAENFLRSR